MNIAQETKFNISDKVFVITKKETYIDWDNSEIGWVPCEGFIDGIAITINKLKQKHIDYNITCGLRRVQEEYIFANLSDALKECERRNK